METASVHPRTLVANKMSELSLVIIAIVFIALLYMLFWPIQTIELQDNPIPVLTKSVVAGDILKYKFTYTKYTKKRCVAHRVLLNDTLINLPAISSIAPIGTHTVTVTVKIPEYAPPGKYILRTKLVYQVNPLRTIERVFDTEEFEVLNDVMSIQQSIVKHGKMN